MARKEMTMTRILAALAALALITAATISVIAFRTFTPCNWYGIKVPQGTPGSWG
jgi:hypothetical protein